ncbi:hypothetical protein C8J57DRAFT_1247677 [Mycena rebaudengoi]|nr:hypothetical protein C8J57DRAFT_1542617 [Mycena rebaudengoi]KAJ7222820.1 hypothetical protein C8J57DRAFT_1536233 [Mycena rebaudengoi]KAJ7236691.1 hypothetical protein C8J57DRAFT_1247677 [Mycena rebaudengoi]
MQFSTILITLAVAFSPALAAPTAEPAAGEPTVAALEKRAVGVFVCTGQNFSGQCNHISPPFNVCQPFSATGLTGYQSWGPDQGTTCLWYTGGSCTGTQSGAVNFPGYTDVPDFWKFNTASFKCWT